MAEPTYDEFESKVMQAAITMLANSSTFQAIAGQGASIADAKKRIIEVDGGSEDDVANQDGRTGKTMATDGTIFETTENYALVYELDFPVSQDEAFSFESRNGQVSITLYVARATDDKPHWQARRFLNQMGAIRREMNAVVGQTIDGVAIFAHAAVSATLERLTDAEKEADRSYVGKITIDWSIT